jgi:hypothetical protein
MAGIDDIIGGWVKEAEKSGEVKRLPGYGKPLDLDDDRHVPPKHRMAYRVLKNAGYTPPEVEMIRQVASLKADLEAETDPARREALEAQLIELQHKLDVALNRSSVGL